ncbi:matrix-binding protein [Actinoplanes sp. SE50]|uniref:polymorphic toxin-type HINT domain-containing protein n=1 Tax=unclassified Actinoplanes TaxID=2626549 RepID=UPI00023EC55B|nr:MULTISPECIES: polymorphic toxin-type HINT domain-containing protein [unclassified Actinoplanes]AEV81405.1 Extracellular matrix-binding protein ebhB [Actinoplanes sp. SE50/110]ATO79808.1 matrix-binding protein [Actinoplanes sp. SE50]SLL97210.1 hypothetical protein ACSP50_0408 [Actinoplanes sp. SE50/110]
MQRRRLRWIVGLAAGLAVAVAVPGGAAVAAPRVQAPVVQPHALTVQEALQQLLGADTKAPADTPIDDADLDRMLTQDLADYDADPAVRAAATAVLATNDPAQIKDFLDNGLPVYRKADQQRQKDQADHNRVQVQEWAVSGSPTVRQRAQAALDSNDNAKIAAFVATGHDAADLADKQDALNAAQQAKLIQGRVEQMVANGGYEVQKLGQAALDSEDPVVIAEFYNTGYAAASKQDADAQQQITDALAARSKAVADLTDLAQRAAQAADAQKKIIQASVAATQALTSASNAMGLANKEAKQADSIYAADIPLRNAGKATHTTDVMNLRMQACQDAVTAQGYADQVTGQSGVAATAAQTLDKTGLSHNIAWADVIQAQADAGTSAAGAAMTACQAATATEGASRTLDADHAATVDANNAVKYRQAAEREQASAEKLADRAEKLAAAAQAAATDAHNQRVRAENDADSAQGHADNAAADYQAAKQQQAKARAAASAAISQSITAYQAAGRAIDQQNIVIGKAGEAKTKQEDALAAGAAFAGKAQRAKTLIEKAKADDQNTSSKEFAAQAAEAHLLSAEMACKYPDNPSGNGCPGTAEMQRLRNDAASLRAIANAAKNASDQSKRDANAASDASSAAAADARQAAAAAAAAAADARAAEHQAALARQDAADAKTAAVKAIKDANAANADARAAVQAARTSINKATAARADADMTAQAAQDAVRQSAVASFWSRISGRAAIDARITAAGIADPAASAIDVASGYAATDSDAAMAVDIANNALQIADSQATAAQQHADDAAAAAAHAQQMADLAVAQVKPAYVAAQKAAEAANRAVQAANTAIQAAKSAAKEAQGAVDAAKDAAEAARDAGNSAQDAAIAAAQAGSDSGTAQQAANNASGYASKAQQAATNANVLSGKISDVSTNITNLSNSIWGIAQAMSGIAKDLKNAAWAKYNAEQAAAEAKVNDWIDDKANWLNDHVFGGSQIGKGITDSAAGMAKGLLVTSSCVGGTFLGSDNAAGDEWSVPDVSYLPKSDKACNALVKGIKDLILHPWELLHWSDWKEKGWQYTLGEVIFDVVTIGGTDGLGIFAKLGESGAIQTAKAAIKDIAKMSAKDLLAGAAKFTVDNLSNAIKALGTVDVARLLELSGKIGAKLTFSPEELAALSKAAVTKGMDAIEDTLRKLGSTPVLQGLKDLVERCFTPHSFTADTRVVLADGSTRRIADIAVGDRVLAVDPITYVRRAEPVTALHRDIDTTLADVKVRDRAGRISVIHTTPGHVFWDQSNLRWVEAARLASGTLLASADAQRVTVVDVQTFGGSQPMYDLTVAAIHSFMVVAGRSAVLVHNEQTARAPKPDVDHDYLKTMVRYLYKSLDLAPELNITIYGDGTTMAALMNEWKTGEATNGSEHLTKIRDVQNGLTKFLNTEGYWKKPKKGEKKVWIDFTTRTSKDIAVATDLLKAVNDSLANSYVDFSDYKALLGC